MKKFALGLVTVLSLATFVATPLLAAPQAAPEKPANATAAVAATININTATVAELESLPGIGKKTAESIVAYRTEKGKFKSTKDLLKVKGIGDKSFEKFKNLVSVE